ncbi:hypothetical protein [Olsenella uli]
MSDNAHVPDWMIEDLSDLDAKAGDAAPSVSGGEGADVHEAHVRGAGAQDVDLEGGVHTSQGQRYVHVPARGHAPYVRQRAPHRTQEAINDVGTDDDSPAAGYQHDSNVTIGHAFSGGSGQYRRARRNVSGLKGSRYGQYLEIPKGRRSIFRSQESIRKRRSVLSLIVVMLVLALVAAFIWHLLNH